MSLEQFQLFEAVIIEEFLGKLCFHHRLHLLGDLAPLLSLPLPITDCACFLIVRQMVMHCAGMDILMCVKCDGIDLVLLDQHVNQLVHLALRASGAPVEGTINVKQTRNG